MKGDYMDDAERNYRECPPLGDPAIASAIMAQAEALGRIAEAMEALVGKFCR